eukprot:TRINITY_DN19733_c0_g1_i1.p1 TRINITY_DN19733_c0_g1~~TRINITY_DN19733_c0_g1_i1.p1  ORF type:complete len:563 (+),score=83.68 TRINITY_DN19733_c0_g1_i1:66-1754(+)
MGQGHASSLNGPDNLDLSAAKERAEALAGRLCVASRYHSGPSRRVQDDYEDRGGEVLGVGMNGSVRPVHNRLSGLQCAAKSFQLNGLRAIKCKEIETEVEILLTIDHPNLARLADVYATTESVTLVMEALEGGELFERVASVGKFSEVDAADALRQMLLAVKYLHQCDVVHRDLKLENWLYDKKDGKRLMLIDFGLSKYWEPTQKMGLKVGTLNYIAPEVLDGSYTSQCDLWSLGVIAYTLLTGGMPFVGGDDGDDEMLRCIKKGEYSLDTEDWATVSQDAKSFVSGLMTVDPQCRMNDKAALAHPWIVQHQPPMGAVDKGIVAAMCAYPRATTFRRMCLSVMAWALTSEERLPARDAFLELDSEKTGSISFGELEKALAGRHSVSTMNVRRIFDAMALSASNGGALAAEGIHYASFLSAMISTPRIPVSDKLLQIAFSRIDEENNGFISPSDIQRLLGDSVDEAAASRILSEADESGTGIVSLQDFKSYFARGGGKDGNGIGRGGTVSPLSEASTPSTAASGAQVRTKLLTARKDSMLMMQNVMQKQQQPTTCLGRLCFSE